MLPFRIVRSSVLLAGVLAALGPALQASDGGFTTYLSDNDKASTGMGVLTETELTVLDRLVSIDASASNNTEFTAVSGRFSDRLYQSQFKDAGLDKLTPSQLEKLDTLVGQISIDRPLPKERPRLRESYILSEKGRLKVHGGISFTIGGGSGGSFRGGSTWVSYHDPVTGISLGFSFSKFKGDGFYGLGSPYYPGYDYDQPFPRYYPSGSTLYRPATARRITRSENPLFRSLDENSGLTEFIP